MGRELQEWLLNSDEPWTRYRTFTDLYEYTSDHGAVQKAYTALQNDKRIAELFEIAEKWEETPIKRHNDASHPITIISTLADFGLKRGDDRIDSITEKILSHQADNGALQSLITLPKFLGLQTEAQWSWMGCDSPTLLFALLSFGFGDDPRLGAAIKHLVNISEDNGWQCIVGDDMKEFRGPGKKGDPCPITNVYALKALSQVPDYWGSPAVKKGTEALLNHWEHRTERKLYMFGIGTDFHKVKFPFMWYDLLHVVDVLSRFPFVHGDARFLDMVTALMQNRDPQGKVTASSMYRAWKEWSFADKKEPSPWLTLLTERILTRLK